MRVDRATGKTTLIHLLLGLRIPTQGSIHFIDSSSKEEIHDRLQILDHCGWLEQSPYYEAVSGEEFISKSDPKRGSGNANARIAEAAKQADVDLSKLVNVMDAPPLIRKRLALARVLIRRPSVLLVDEPLSGLSLLSAKLAFGETLIHASRHRTMILFTQNYEEVEMLRQCGLNFDAVLRLSLFEKN